MSERTLVITVPNREKTTRSNVRCPECGCQYNPNRHLRSFDRDRLADLVPGFRLGEVAEFGPRAPTYPRPLRLGLERLGVLHRPGSPACPQCGYQLHGRQPVPQDEAATHEPATTGANGGGIAHAGYRLARRLAPRARHPYFLGARYERA